MSEQKHPAGAPGEWKKPNFGLIVALSAIAILVILAAAVLFARRGAHDVNPRVHQSFVTQSSAINV